MTGKLEGEEAELEEPALQQLVSKVKALRKAHPANTSSRWKTATSGGS